MSQGESYKESGRKKKRQEGGHARVEPVGSIMIETAQAQEKPSESLPNLPEIGGVQRTRSPHRIKQGILLSVCFSKTELLMKVGSFFQYQTHVRPPLSPADFSGPSLIPWLSVLFLATNVLESRPKHASVTLYT